ncbi:MAG: DUF4838 domain-containing protein [Lentisphaeria bacterium]|nr:DUF4838 domain-containing protein [Lentisphaeria bacterium]
MKKLLTLLLLCAALTGFAKEFSVKPENALIVVSPKEGAVARLAARELQYFVKMMTGKTIPIVPEAAPGKYVFLFQKPANVKLKPEEAVWETTETRTRFYGDSTPLHPRTGDEGIFRRASRSGDLTAVYDFLERQLGFLFIAPGKLGTSFSPAAVLKLKTGKNSWEPGSLVKRSLRYNMLNVKAIVNNQEFPESYRKKAPVDVPKRNLEALRWQKQMRMGASVFFRYGHAFTTWWKRYGAKHPEYFALHKGKRAPWGDPANIKMCPSNSAFIDRIIDNWKNEKVRSSMINVCENDWTNYCECAACRKLDAPARPGQKWDADLTDRYLWMANEVLRRARKIDPKVQVCFYAYSVYRFPPRKFRVSDGIIIGFVPHMLTAQQTDTMYKEWRKWGAKAMFQRPNDQHINTGLPMGIEEVIFNHFQIGYKNGMIGTDYDSLHGFWGATGIADYILARAHIYPQKSFAEHLDEYCSAYGAAAPEVKAYYNYWRKEIFVKRLFPNREEIGRKGRYGNFRRGLMWDLPRYYFIKDFDNTDAILKKGLKKKLNSCQKALLEQLLLSNKHARLSYGAMSASGQSKLGAAKALHTFREQNWDKVNMNWYFLFQIESGFGDVTGGKLAAKMGRFSDGKSLPLYWYFTPDPKNEGSKNNWHKSSLDEAVSCWDMIKTDSGWEIPGSRAPEAMKKFMKNYDGTGWYALDLRIPQNWKGKKIYLIFAAVDESAWIYLNGKFCGERIYKEEDDWKKSFEIRIDQNIDWSKKPQTLIVKVHDRGGQGGIWRPVVLGAE